MITQDELKTISKVAELRLDLRDRERDIDRLSRRIAELLEERDELIAKVKEGA